MPALGTLVFLLLLMRESDSTVVFGRYSVDYAVLITLFGLNVLLLWIRTSHSSSVRLVERLNWPSILSLTIALFSIVFLFDLFAPRSFSVWPAHLVIFGLIAASLSQLDTLRSRSFVLPLFAMTGMAIVFAISAAECLMVFFLLKSVTPRTEREFLDLMRNPDYFGWTPWPEPIAEQKPPDTYRFIGLADSFGIWGGPESNYFRLLENLLQAGSSARVQLVNLSIDGYEPSHQLQSLRFGMRYSPDLVVHGFFVGNDFTLSDDRIYKFLGHRTRRPSDAVPYRPRDFLLRGWAETIRALAGERRRIERERQAGFSTGTFSKETFLAIQQFRLRTWGTPGDVNLRYLKSVFPLLDEIRRVAETGGARFVLVIHPDQTQVDEELRRELVTSFGLREQDFDFDLPQQVVLEYCAARRVTCLDLLPTFRDHADAGSLFLLRDTHYNDAGRRLAAATIRDFLARQGIGPEPRSGGVTMHSAASRR